MDPKNTRLVQTGLPAGMNDYGPQQMLARKRMLTTINEVYRRFGFVTLQTSVVQRRLALTGNEGTSMRLWQMRVDGSRIVTDPEAQLAARFDLTVPLAEYVARNMNTLTFPFRRTECGYVYRGEKPQAGRFCGFMQFDADIVGTLTGPADAEIIWCMSEVMSALGFTDFLVRVNNRKVLNGLCELLGLDPAGPQASWLIRLLDKLDKLDQSKVLSQLAGIKDEDEDASEEDGNSSQENNFSLSQDQLALVKQFLDEARPNSLEEIDALRTFFDDRSTIGAEGVDELATIASLLEASGVSPTTWSIDRTVARGLAYYTGPVFETVLTNARDFGSVFSGGRFDDLVARFTGESLPSVGASIGVDRLFDAMERMGLVTDQEPETDVYLMSFGKEFEPELFSMMAELRRAGVSCEMSMGYQDTSFRAQLAIGLQRQAPIILIYGQRERDTGMVQIKDTRTRSQISIKRSKLASHVLTSLNRET